jgi:branched-chain amino acid transport system permease protein
MGINVTAYKMWGLILSASLAGLGGALNAHFSSFIAPGEFGFESAVAILSYVVLGGVSSPFGPVVGAFLLTALPELLRSLHEFRGIFNGLIIVVVMIFLPKGLLGFRMKRTG